MRVNDNREDALKYPVSGMGCVIRAFLAMACQLGQLREVKENMASRCLVLTRKAAHSPPVAETVGLTSLSPNCRGPLGQYYRVGEGHEDNGY